MHRPRRLVLVAMATASILLAASPLSATAAPAARDVDASRYVVYQAHEFRTFRFTTPDGNVSCELYETTGPTPWACSARKHTWRMPSLPSGNDLQGVGQDALGVQSAGGGFVMRPYNKPDLQVVRPARLLPVGSRIRMDGLTCTVARRSGVDLVRCADSGGAVLTISRKRLSYSPAA